MTALAPSANTLSTSVRRLAPPSTKIHLKEKARLKLALNGEHKKVHFTAAFRQVLHLNI